ncbi:hypothetical protein N665_0763s0014 [Sinapis alba]|nr:hypothetical protein N665_0763s0014 [Sinapis alba]
MNYLISILLMSMHFGLNEGIVCNIDNRHLPQCRKGCLLNTLEFQNKLIPERGLGNRIVWRCLLQHGHKLKYSQILWRAYRGAMRHRCGEKRAWIARADGIYLEKNDETKGFQHPWFITKQ